MLPPEVRGWYYPEGCKGTLPAITYVILRYFGHFSLKARILFKDRLGGGAGRPTPDPLRDHLEKVVLLADEGQVGNGVLVFHLLDLPGHAHVAFSGL